MVRGVHPPYTLSGPTTKKNMFYFYLCLPSASGSEVSAWYGIPFARPPIGDLRFRYPIANDKWEGVLNTTAKPNSCVQNMDEVFPGFQGSEQWNANTPRSEDCLYLNVVVPKVNGVHVSNASVLVWIYGGGYYSGTSTLDVYDMRTLAAEENIILVSIQYRVASLAFLYLGTEDVPGNADMMDQVMAMRWVKCNIAKFGGNPQSITLMGESAGAHSVALHLLAPLSQNLFTRAILQSTGATAPWGANSKKEGFRRSMKLAELVGCPSNRSRVEETIGCMREKDAFELVANDWGIPSGLTISIFAPIIDGRFLADDPKILMNNKTFKQTDILLGSNQDEGNFFIMYYASEQFPKENNVQLSKEDFVTAVDTLYVNSSPLEREAMRYEYTNWLNPEDTTDNRINVDRMVGDSQFTCSVVDLGQTYAKAGNNVYMYYFNQVSSASTWPKWAGSMHGDEIHFLFGLPLNCSNNYSEAEVSLSKKMMNYWANFAKTGNPSSEAKAPTTDRDSWSLYTRVVNYWSPSTSPSLMEQEDDWPAYTPMNRETKVLNANVSRSIIMKSGQSYIEKTTKRCAFWQDFIPKLAMGQKSKNKK